MEKASTSSPTGAPTALVSNGDMGHIQLPIAPVFAASEKPEDNWVTQCKHYLEQGSDIIEQAFADRVAIRHLIHARAVLVDQLLCALWRALITSDKQATLVAVGGYGRAELHPGSDIDLLILLTQPDHKVTQQQLQTLITFLWDIGLNIGQSVRTVKECISLAKSDITIATNLMESRLLDGHAMLFDELIEKTQAKYMWPVKEFFDAKVAEQKARYRKYQGSSFDLEPNLKGSPGGLRDIQLVGWIAKRHFRSDSLQALTNQGVFTVKEYRTLMACQHLLWRLRFVLHSVTGRSEDRLLFEHQKKVAEKLGFKDKPEALAVEQLMKKYFRAAITVRNLTELLLQVFEEAILEEQKPKNQIPIDDDFLLENDRIRIKDNTLFVKKPELILKTFIVAAQVPGNKHVGARTLRAIRDNRHLIDQAYRDNPLHKQLFLDFFKLKHSGDRPFFLMKRNGILARFLPAFEKISGQMQFDMFHTFTVDEHTLFLLKNLVGFNDPEQAKEFPYCAKIMEQLEQPELIFLAGLFHDIAKGRGGDHSELGADDAYHFSIELGLNEKDAQIVSWLVRFHLIMSLTAQRKDISDPDVISNFASQVKNQQQLDLLYILTVADIRATSPKLWNSWKAALLQELYLTTTYFLKQGQQELLTTTQHIEEVKRQARSLLANRKVSLSKAEALWLTLDENYFNSSPVERIASQAESIVKHAHGKSPLVEIKRHHNQGGTEIFIYITDQADLFAAITATLSQKNLRVQAAELHTTNDGYCLDTFVVLEENGTPIQSSSRIQSIKKLLQKNLKNISGMSKRVNRYLSSRMKQFDVTTEVKFTNFDDARYTQLELTVLDRPGLLARIGETFKECGIIIHSARIVTLGEKVEDTFIISTPDEQAIVDKSLQEKIKQTIIERLK
ncbi:[protein-PII] uridylyltransferase [Pleionea sp. CnH1-48]|uniref:[protein-PII] uridylyltransferase n=1 Tax=Pleionea sp. CnH1-48 TaxID=2954494 RepID=UPI0020984F5F|nr:[protein-PII] uridylyltransferase [Pleionea sp. CnH1-48]MCO7226506.1 [protein-PII] uridylyltransferase [Pleionea sp. CnH1-48]